MVHDGRPFRGRRHYVVAVYLGRLTVDQGVDSVGVRGRRHRRRRVMVVVHGRASARVAVDAGADDDAAGRWANRWQFARGHGRRRCCYRRRVTVALRHLHEVRHARSQAAVVRVVWKKDNG